MFLKKIARPLAWGPSVYILSFMSNAVDLLDATDLSTETRSALVAGARKLFADCALSERDGEAMSNLGAMLADLGVSPKTVDGVLADLLGAQVEDVAAIAA